MRIQSIIPLTLKIVTSVVGKGIRNIYLVGSLASGESTVLNKDSYVSDVDLIIDVNLVALLRLSILNTRKILSETLSEVFRSQGFGFHVSPMITCMQLARYLKSVRPNTIYLYEMTPIMCREKKPKFLLDSSYKKPSVVDSLNLSFSAIADYLFLKYELFENMDGHRKTYVIAKRCLTLLNSLLLFKGLYSRSYSERIRLAVHHSAKLALLLDHEDFIVLQILTEFKLKGDPKVLEKLQLNLSDRLAAFLNKYFERLALKILIYELAEYTGIEKGMQDNLMLFDLLRKYESKMRVSTISDLSYMLSQIAIFTRDRDKRKLKIAFNALFTKRLKSGDLTRLLVGKAFARMVSGETDLQKKHIENIKLLWDLFMV